MKTNRIIMITAALLLFSCKTNVFTGKKTFNFVDNEAIFPTAFAQYNQVLDESKVITDTDQSRMIKRVGQNIKTAAQRWLNALGHPEYLDGYSWEFNLIQDDQVNAWAMPGGKIAFYTGILPIAETETGVAVIMGHEVAHALANHGAQRMSKAQAAQIGGGIVSIAAGGQSQTTQAIIGQAYGLGAQYGVILPFSRASESEADKIGLILTAIAGYDPYEGADLWRRMKANSGGQSPPQFMSTHPSNDSRIQNLTELAPVAAAEAAKYGVTNFK